MVRESRGSGGSEPATQDLEEIFHAALDCRGREDREALLDRACGGDPERRLRIEGLLFADPLAGSFLESPAQTPCDTIVDLSSDAAGAFVGPYTLLERIGEGGMGTVYLAEQTVPVRRKVALKVVKAGMDSRQVIARFEVERQTLALMDHPNIARVLDAGTTDSGRPFFVMELVAGEPITDYCDRRRLSVVERLELFVQVCRAVQHAHQKGIIHRDLKPSNVLVAEVDDAPVPKVIDFGVAKATSQGPIEPNGLTVCQQLVGTPLYMSPEQADRSGVDVDTRADVYSLGVMLYELLTGTTPFDRETARKLTLADFWRLVREMDPPTPSARLGASGDSLSSVSARRSTGPRQLVQAARGDLDWIVMKALEKDRNRRYETANGLAADVARYLSGQPVEACPPSLRYRLGKYLGRNRGWLTAAAVVLLSLLAATAVSISQAIRARDAEAGARADSRQAREAIDRVVTRVVEELKDVPGALRSRRAVLEDGLAFYQGFLATHAEDPEVKFDVARTELRVASIRKSIGERQEARPHILRAITLLEELVAAAPLAAEYRAELAEAHNSLAEILPPPGGLRGRRIALAIFERLVAEDPGNLEYRWRLAGLYCNLGLALSTDGATSFAEAEQHLREALAVRDQARADFPAVPENPMELARLHHWMGNLLAQTAREPAAEAEYRRSLAHLEGMAAKAPASPDVIERIAHVKSYLAMLLHKTGNREEWQRLSREIVAALEPLWQLYPDHHGYGKRLSGVLHQLGCAYWADHRFPEAEAALARAVAIREEAVERHPGSADLLAWAANMLRSMGTFLHEAGRTQESLQVFRRLIGIQERLANRDPSRASYQTELAWWLSICPSGQLRDPVRAARVAERAVKLDPNSAGCWRVLGIARYRVGDLPAAREALSRALEIDSDDRPAALFLAMIHARRGDRDQALTWHARGVRSLDPWFPSSRLDRLFAAEARSLIEHGQTPRD